MRRTKSRHQKILHVRTLSGATLHYRKGRPRAMECAGCSSALPGMARESNIARTKKRPSRPFGGVYCSSCSRARFKASARAQ